MWQVNMGIIMVATIPEGDVFMGDIEVSRSIIVILIGAVGVRYVGVWDVGMCRI